jgi:anti-sigma-K factor RskA
MMTHEDVSELLAPYALDAVIGEEVEAVEIHLIECPKCRAELDAYRDVAAAMGNSVEPLPEGLWANISSRLPERHDEEPPSMPRLIFTKSGENVVAAEPDVLSRAEVRSRLRGSRNFLAVVGSIAVGAAAIAAVLGINLNRADNRVAGYQVAIGQSTPSAEVAALLTSGHKVINLDNATGHRLARFVITPAGQGYLVSDLLKGLPSDKTYQLWAINNGRSISLGLLGQSPSQSTFTASGSELPSQLGITIEPAGGSVIPSAPMVASGVV